MLSATEPKAAAAYTESLAHFCADLRFENLPGDVVRKTKLCILDAIGTIVAGSTTQLGQAALHAATRFETSGAARILGTTRTASPPAAALVNGTLSELFELQDGWRFGNDHPCVVIPPALAIGEWKASTGKELLTAIVAGYEVTNRLAWSVHPTHLARGYLPTGTAGTYGSAASAARLLKFDAQKTTDAFGVAGFILPISTAENLWAGYSAKPLHSGFAAKLGIEATLLADDGFSGCAIEGTRERGRGPFEITTGEVKFERIVDRLGDYFTVRDVYFKIFPACRHAHGAAEASLNIANGERYRVADIERIRVFTYDLSANLLNRYTDAQSSMIAAQFSIPYVTAAALNDAALDVAQFSDSRIHDEAIIALARTVEVVSDPQINARYPEVTPTRVEVTLRDGRVLESQVDMPKGDPRVPVPESDLFSKFTALAGLALDSDAVARIQRIVLALEELSDVRELTALTAARTPQ